MIHDRPIHTRADDSVVRATRKGTQAVRRARGYVPSPVALGESGPSVLAVGAALKSTVCLTRGANAYLSQHIGDLEGLEGRAFFEEVIAKLERLLAVTPTLIAHDLHPDYVSTRWAQAQGLPLVAVQHHHAHVASCLAEHGRKGPVLGVAFDGNRLWPEWRGLGRRAPLLRPRRVAEARAPSPESRSLAERLRSTSRGASRSLRWSTRASRSISSRTFRSSASASSAA